ncbi:type II toxin-antitoxin system Phd/YefM family antitoxin [bacterium]|nr:type II toxin-antitoxin system Phd/YefM family antitoxin [bacterium]
MEASIIDLRYKMKDILKALNRKENVKILYHGKEKGIIIPLKERSKKKVMDYHFYGMYKKDNYEQTVAQQIHSLRGGRYNDI